MTFDQLEAFLAAVRSDTFFDAAESLHLTQSTLSKQIIRLEKELDLPLFDRSGRSAVLTDAGRAFYEEAQVLITQYRHARARMQSLRTQSLSALRLGTLPILSQYRLTGLLRDFTVLHPEIHLSIEELEEYDLLPGLADGRFDLALIRSCSADSISLTSIPDCPDPPSAPAPLRIRPANAMEFAFYPLAKDRLVAIIPEDHPLADRESVKITDLAEEPLILMHPYTAIYELCQSLFQEAGIRPNIVRTARMESILSAVAIHEGLSLFAEENFNLFRHDSLVSVPVIPAPPLSVGAAARRNVPLSPAAVQFLKFIAS